MCHRLTITLSALILISNWATAAKPQRPDTIRFSRDKKVLFLDAADLAKSLNFELKIVDPQRLVTFCRDKDGGFCIPVRLAADNHRRDGEQLLIAADVVSGALRFRVVETAGQVTIVPRTEPFVGEGQIAAPGYNAPWGRGRGFGKGETLPDIPFVDVAGNEVRFSQYLGKRYILYCWASW
ncbi:MAG: hypothetical protein QF918_08405 [Pirellulaceae bacterium]|jgi:hypothetical protein|nr:hypothetical protein [Pirellulaceae bacterium]MDP6554081.1 hypothetical protein [Pirellulaceae bacterium]MDP6718670.1 hypothetical protein [Pirellulaceae bacterium]